jgi:hypothetical protein
MCNGASYQSITVLIGSIVKTMCNCEAFSTSILCAAAWFIVPHVYLDLNMTAFFVVPVP